MSNCSVHRKRPLPKQTFPSGLQVVECQDCGERFCPPFDLPGSPLAYLSPNGRAKLLAKNPDLYARLDNDRYRRADVRAGLIDTMRAKMNGKAK